MEGTVVKSTGSSYQVKISEDKFITARIIGKFRLNNHRLTNPVAVGDKVVLSSNEDIEGIRTIQKIVERKNYIIRKSNKLSSRAQIIASNLDGALLFITLKDPITSTGFIDRFLVTAEAYHIPTYLIFNKIDTYSEKEIQLVESYINIYETVGYMCFKTNCNDGKTLTPLKEELSNKTCLIVGHSGVGKSTFVNNLLESNLQKTQEISQSSNRGQHTTTFAEMFRGANGINIIDTPGIRDFGVIDIPEVEIAHYFKEFKPLIGECKFNNCIHVNEPDCAIVQAINDDKIDSERYYNYISILRNENMFS